MKRLVQEGLARLGLEVRRRDPYGLRRARWLRQLGIRTVLDVGAHRGEFACEIRRILPEARIVSFEPLAEPFHALERTLAHLGNATAINVALSDREGATTIHRNAYTPSSSLLPIASLHQVSFPHALEATEETIQLRTLDSIARETELQEPLLIKIDVQGLEDRVIAGGQQVLNRTTVVILETSFRELYTGQALFPEIYRLLRLHGFEYEGNVAQLVSPSDGRVLQADSVFVRH